MNMPVEIISMLVVAFAVLYFFSAATIAIGELRIRPHILLRELPMVSVILCARNEESNLPRCLDGLSALDYPHNKLEINLIDDESSDRTLEIFQEYAGRDSRFRVFTTKEEPRSLIGKQRPLNMGVRESTGLIVCVTDADIAVPKDWVKAHVAAYRGNVGVAGGVTRIDPCGRGLFARLQAADLISKIAVAMGFAGLGLPLTIMGNNISFLREAYDATGGFEKMRPRIVEDLALMNAITRQAGCRLGWAAGRGGVVESMPEKTMALFVEQRRRWLEEAGDMSSFGKITVWLEIGMNAAFFMSLILASFSLLPLTATLFSWLGGYALILAANPGATFRDFLHIPLMIFFQLYYAAIIVRRGITRRKKVIWKGREYGA